MPGAAAPLLEAVDLPALSRTQLAPGDRAQCAARHLSDREGEGARGRLRLPGRGVEAALPAAGQGVVAHHVLDEHVDVRSPIHAQRGLAQIAGLPRLRNAEDGPVVWLRLVAVLGQPDALVP